MLYIVDIGSNLYGRTIEVEARDLREALFIARTKIINKDLFERVIQIRDRFGTVFYSWYSEHLFFFD
jgi:ribonuclease HI